MDVGVLGPLEVQLDGRPVAVGGGRLRALLACLALEAGRPVSTGRLVDALWEEDLPADQVHALQSLISRLRRALGNGSLVAPAPGGYRLDVEVDAQHFERLVNDARSSGDPERKGELLREALALWRGPALEDLVDYRFAAAAAARLEDLRLAALADRVATDLALGHGDRLVGELEALCAEHPLHERLAAQLIAALAAAGRQADALAAYERVRRLLSEELGVPPGAELQAAHMAVLQGEQAPRRRTNLSAPVTRFVGREREIAQIGEQLEHARLVTLLGPGGAGKTRLAREAVAGWVDRVTDGVWMVELAPVTAEIDIVPAVLGALGLREAVLREALVARDGLDRLLDVLGDRETILVLDNCEHLIAGVAELADRLLAGCPGLRLVATSREALAISGERLVAVPPLAQTPAEELFADRAAAALPGFVMDEHGSEICRRLDGLPLALELAAARLRSLPVRELAQRLDDRFRLLTGGSRTALPRHRTLRAVVDWSWDLLEEPERRLARRLAVFSAGATVESASAVDETDALDGLAALVERSLLQVVPDSEPTRYRMLETLREYGLEKLEEAGELQDARTRHARYFADLAARAEPELRRAAQRRWYALLEDERENIVAGLRHLGDTGDAHATVKLAVTLLWYWLLSGSEDEARTWLEFALAVPGEADPDDRALAEGVLKLAVLGEAGDMEALQRAVRELLEQAASVDDRERPLVAMAKVVLWLFAGDEGRADEAQVVALEHPDPWVRAATHMLAAGRAENAGSLDIMRDELATARERFETLGDSWGLAMARFLEANRLLLVGELEAAERTLEEAREAMQVFSPENAAGMIDVRLADVRLRLGDLEGARELAQRARARRDLGADDGAVVQSMQARVAWLSGDVEGARAELLDARERLARRGSSLPQQGHGEALVEGLMASLEAERGDFEAAERALASAHALAMATTDMPIVASVAVAAAAVAVARGERTEASELLAAAVALRGADDPTNPEIVRLGITPAVPPAREGALVRLAAAVSRTASEGP
jgi:predicted ATPase/DNA-binding winged helix-turn-helix (wHTH) protein